MKRRNAATTIVAAILLLLMASPFPSHAVRGDWTAEELQCAASIGVVLDRPYRSVQTSIKTLAWIAPVVVRGRVTNIESDLDGPYHTNVYVAISSVEKGSYSGDALIVKLHSGLQFSDATGLIGRQLAEGEPSFSTIGQEVLLFLDTDYMRFSGDPSHYQLSANEFTLAPKGKYTIESGRVKGSDFPVEDFPLEQVLNDISATVQAQSSNCS